LAQGNTLSPTHLQIYCLRNLLQHDQPQQNAHRSRHVLG